MALEQGADPQDQLVGVGHAAANVHGDGDLHRQGQHLGVVLSEPVAPYRKGVLAEFRRFDVPAAQVQSPDLIDDERAKCLILRTQEPVVGLQVLKREIIDLVVSTVIGVARI